MAIEWKKNDLPTLAQKVADDASETCQNFIYIILSDFAIAGAKAVAIVPVRCYHKSTTTNTGQEDNSYG